MNRFGYPDKKNPERTNFGGIYKAGSDFHARTGLRLELSGFETGKKFDAGGSLALVDAAGEVAAEWSYAKLIDHWKRKHAAACFVPSLRRDRNGASEYLYGRGVLLATGATFGKLLAAIDRKMVYLDPAMKLIISSRGNSTQKKRSQFRAKYKDLEALYEASTYYGGRVD